LRCWKRVLRFSPPAPELNAETDELAAKGCETIRLYVRDENSRVEAVRKAETVNGSISVLVNNAGYGQYGPIEEIPLDAIREQFEVNVFGLIRMCQLALPECGAPGMEVSAFGVNVIGVLPGPVDTNFADKAVAAIPYTGEDSPYFTFKQNLAKYTREMLSPDKTTTLTPEEVAQTIVKAATAENPSTNYHVGILSKAMSAIAGIVPDKIWDAAMERQIPVDEKK
jgi:short-subunit dehydrogenase